MEIVDAVANFAVIAFQLVLEAQKVCVRVSVS